MCTTPGAVLGVSLATQGYAVSQPASGNAVATMGYVPNPLPAVYAADITVVPLAPLDLATDVLRGSVLQFRIDDPNVPLEMDTLKIQYRQVPFPAESADGWETVYLGASRAEIVGDIVAGFQPGFDTTTSSITVSPYSGTGERAFVDILPVFGLMPGGTHSLRVEIFDCDGNITTTTWTFTTLDDASTVSLRSELYRLRRQAERFGWDGLLSAASSFAYEVDTIYTGARIDVTVNESLLADIGDQLSESAYGLDILNNVRRYQLRAKLSEYPRVIDDEDNLGLFDGFVDGGVSSPVFADRQLPETQFKVTYTDAQLQERVWRYYNVFILVPPTEDAPDWRWVYGDSTTFINAFSYGRYGHGAVLFDLVPDKWKIEDAEQA